MKIKILSIILFFGITLKGVSQAIPAKEENIPFLVTFGKDAKSSYGDDDNCQIFFFSIPKDYKKPFYIRVFDPEIGGENDEIVGSANTKTKYSVYGGKGCVSDKAARQTEPIGNYKSGNLLGAKSFETSEKYDNKWYSFGPFNPSDGEFSEQYYGYIFKVITEGVSGNDGNLYRYYLSASPSSNIAVEGGNAFTFEYTFRLHADSKQISHVYPYVDNKVVSVKQTNFDWDNDGKIKLYSVSAIGRSLNVSGDDSKRESTYMVKTSEKGSSLDIQFQKQKEKSIKNNNVVFNITNQYGEAMPFFTVPIGGVPKYKGKVVVTPNGK